MSKMWQVKNGFKNHILAVLDASDQCLVDLTINQSDRVSLQVKLPHVIT